MIIDFMELDHMRETIRSYGRRHGLKLPSKRREYWKQSGFYVGRTVVRFYFRAVSIISTGLISELKSTFGVDYIVKVDVHDITFTLRKERQEPKM